MGEEGKRPYPPGLIAEILQFTPEYELDDVLERAKRNVLDQRKQEERDNIFPKSSLETLQEKGCPSSIYSSLSRQEGGAKEAHRNFNGHTVGTIFILPVIPRGLYGLYGLMAMVRNGSAQGRVDNLHLDPREIGDTVPTPTLPYYCLDVDLGEETMGMSVTKARKHIEAKGRSPLTVDEVIALATHTKVLLKRALWAASSEYKSGGLPLLFLRDGQPELLVLKELNDSIPGCVPSCQRRGVYSGSWLAFTHNK